MSRSGQSNLRRWRNKALLALCSSLICLAGLEGILRWWDVGDPPAFETNSEYGFLMQPNQSVSTRGYRFRINHAGLRGDDFLMPKPSAVDRIAFLGDSVTYGGGAVRDKDLFVNRVASFLGASEGRQVEAINVSAPGWGIENIAGYVAAVGLFDADLVVWVISSADFRRPKTSIVYGMFRTRKPKSRLLYVCNVSWRMLSRFFLQRVSLHRDSYGDRESLKRNLQVFRSTLAQITRKGTAVAVVVVPSVRGYEPVEDLLAFRSAAASCSVPFLDTAPTFHRPRSEELFSDGEHLSTFGHEIIADVIARFLKENSFNGQPPNQLTRPHLGPRNPPPPTCSSAEPAGPPRN